MGKSNGPDPPNYRKYGVPFYSVDWVPYKAIKFDRKSEGEKQQDPDQTQSDDNAPAADTDTENADGNYVVLAGGGGEGRSGIPNAIVLAQFDPTSNSLSDQPVTFLLFCFSLGKFNF